MIGWELADKKKCSDEKFSVELLRRCFGENNERNIVPRSKVSSTNSCFQSNRRNSEYSNSSSETCVSSNCSFLTFSDAATPVSQCNDQFMRGLYSFADQLLHSLSGLECQSVASTVSSIESRVIAARRRNCRSDSCPAVPDYKDYMELVSRKSNMKNRRTSCCAPSSTNQRHVFANQLAVSILDEATI